jgi:CRISPR system Cascade subunit CasB
MTYIEKETSKLPDFAEVRKRYERFSRGEQVQLGKRIGTPEDLVMIPAFYKLFPGIIPNQRHRQVAFILPYCKHFDDARSLGAHLATVKTNEKRLFQVVRSESPTNLIYLRRLIQKSEITVDWNRLGKSLFFWNDNEIAKREFIEEYFITRHAGKGK